MQQVQELTFQLSRHDQQSELLFSSECGQQALTEDERIDLKLSPKTASFSASWMQCSTEFDCLSWLFRVELQCHSCHVAYAKMPIEICILPGSKIV